MAKSIDWKEIRDGNKTAFDRMFDCYYHSLCSFAASYVADIQVVEDIVIDCFTDIWEKRSSLDIKSSLQNYLLTIVKNSAISYRRKTQLQQSGTKVLKSLTFEEEKAPLEDAELLNELYKAIDRLPEQRRKILKMAAFEGKSYAIIAEELQISVNTVKTQMSRSYRFLKEELNVSYRTVYLLLSL
ncbi:MAG: RNA polymerase sigma-70 factor [Mangrovibacterium sp.]